jgi:hypothetical protein
MIGTSRAGKSTLMEHFIPDWRKQTNTRTLIIDTKPRFHAQYEINGLPTGRRYAQWRSEGFIPYAYRLPVGMRLRESDWQIARQGTPKQLGTVIIAQTDDPDDYAWLDRSVIQPFYSQTRKSIDEYLVVDEGMAFLRGRMTHSKGIVQAIVSGGEKGIGVLFGAQRPKNIPNECMTEMTKCYVFQFDYEDDIKKFMEMGAPPYFEIPNKLYYFSYWDKWKRLYIPRIILDL